MAHFFVVDFFDLLGIVRKVIYVLFAIMLSNVFLTIIAVLTILILLGSIYSLFAAIFFFVFSLGDDDKRVQAQNSLKYMVIGLLLTAVLLFFVPYVFTFFHLPGAELFNFTNVLARMREILSALLRFGGMRGEYVEKTTIIDSSGSSDLYYSDYKL